MRITTGQRLPWATVGVRYQEALGVVGGTPPYDWSCDRGLPRGLALDSASGVISGVPRLRSQFQTYLVTVCDDAGSEPASAYVDLLVKPSTAPAITPAVLPPATVGVPYQVTLGVTGGTPPFRWSWSGTTPEGLSLSSSGSISGIPTTPTGSPPPSFVVSAQAGAASSDEVSASFRLAAVVAPLVIDSVAIPAGTVGVPYTLELEASGGWGGYSWSCPPDAAAVPPRPPLPGGIPSGLSLRRDGTIVGTPTAPTGPSPMPFRVGVVDNSQPPNAARALLELVVEPKPVQGAPWFYVANNGSSSVSQYRTGADGLVPADPAEVPAAVSACGVAVGPDAASLYVVDGSGVSQYDIDPTAGELTPKAIPTVAAGNMPQVVVVSPDRRSAYVTNGGDATLSQYDVDPTTGALTPKATATVATGAGPVWLAVSPDGESGYVSNLSDNTLSAYDIDAETGAMTPKAAPSGVAGYGACGLLFSLDGASLYVADNTGDVIHQYDVGATGGLAPKSPATVATADNPIWLAISPDGKRVYAPNYTSGTVSQYDVDAATGALASMAVPTVPTGASPYSVAVSPDGKSAYVSNVTGNTVSQYDVDSATGALTPKSIATLTTGTRPWGMAFAAP